MHSSILFQVATTTNKLLLDLQACTFRLHLLHMWKVFFLHCRDTALREVPVQVVSKRTAEAGQHEMEHAHVAVSVTASVEHMYQTIKVNSVLVCCCTLF